MGLTAELVWGQVLQKVATGGRARSLPRSTLPPPEGAPALRAPAQRAKPDCS